MGNKSGRTNVRLLNKARGSKAQRVPPLNVRERLIKTALLRWRVFGAYIGQKKRKGRWTSDLALVCLTTQKLPTRQVAQRRRIPRKVTWRERGRTYRLPTDVIQAAAEITLQASAIAGPGDAVRAGGSRAMVGVVIAHPDFGRCLTTAGHLFKGANPVGRSATVTAGNKVLPVTVRKCLRKGGVDYALLSPNAPCDCDNLFQDLIRIGPIFIPAPPDKGARLFVLDGVSDSQSTICRGVSAKLKLGNGVFEDVVVTDPVTRDGASGAALVDVEGRVWGLLIGRSPDFSVFMPAHTLLWREQARLI